MRDLISEILQTLSHNKLRTSLTGLSVSWGIFMLIVLLSMARGVTNSFEENIASGSHANMRIWGGMTSKPYHGNREGRRINLKEREMSVLEDEHPQYVKEVSSVIYGNNDTISTGTKSVSTAYTGVYPSYIKTIAALDIVDGRNINDNDMKRRSKVMLLPIEYAKQLFPPEGKGAVGQRVTCAGLSFQIIGVYEGRWSRDVYIPFTTAQMMARDKYRLGSMTVSLQNVKTEEDGDKAEEGIRNTLAQSYDFDPKDESALWINNRFNDSLQQGTAMSMLNIGVWILGILTLLTGVVGISNIMFVSVRERTHEIGIRRAIGAKPRSILSQILAESVAITLLFGYIGIVFGTLVSQLLAMAFADVPFLKNPTVSLSIAFEVTAVLVIAGAFAGLFPALKALKVKPVEALRDE